MRRPQFTVRTLLVVMLAAACFFGGIHFEQHRKQRRVVPPDTFHRGVQTIYVRMANVTELRNDWGKQLAEVVCLHIDTTTPYKAVAMPSEADSELLCTLSAERQTQNGDEKFLTVKWADNKGVRLQPPLSIRLHPSELTDKRATSHIARRIATIMEAPW